MKLIISQGGVKRELRGAFAMCLSQEDLTLLITLLQAQEGAWKETGGSYGWIRIDPSHPDQDSRPNTKPLAWTDPGNVNPPSDR